MAKVEKKAPTDLDLHPFIVNRWLSMRQDLVEVVNELQCYTIGLLRPAETYRLYYELLPANKTFAKYVKGKKDEKFSDHAPITISYDMRL